MEAVIRWVLRGILAFGRFFQRGGPHYGSVMYGFVGSRALMSGLALGFFDALEEGPKTQAELVEELGLDPDGVRIILDACVVHNVLRHRRGTYLLHPSFRRWLAKDGVRDDLLHTRLAYDDTSALEDCARGDWPEDSAVRVYWGGNYQDLTEEQSHLYSKLMKASVTRSAGFVAKAFPINDVDSVLDGGGGSATLGITLAKAHKGLRVGVLDLAPQEEAANARIAEEGLTDRVEFIPGDFIHRALPGDWSAMLVHRVLWDWKDEPALVLLGRIHEALPEGGRVLVAEGMWSGDRDVDVLFNPFHLYMCLGGFRLRGRERVMEMVREAGFTGVHARVVQPVFFPMVVGIKGPKPPAAP